MFGLPMHSLADIGDIGEYGFFVPFSVNGRRGDGVPFSGRGQEGWVGGVEGGVESV